jgi:hypothetical protein
MPSIAPALGAVLALAVVTPAIAATPVTGVSLRVEGPKATIIAERNQAAATTLVADRTGPVRTVTGPTVLGQLVRAGVATDTPVRASFTDQFGPLSAVVERIGPADQGTAFNGPGFWLYKVNHRAPDVAANQQRLKRGDEVLWYFTSDFEALELELRAPSAPLAAGASFSVQVRAFNAKGGSKPAAGARVRYGARTATAGADGRVALVAVAGRRALTAMRGTDIRSTGTTVCAFRRAVTECLPARPDGSSLRVVVGGRTFAGWAAAAPRLRRIAAGTLDASAIAWRGRVTRGEGPTRALAATLVDDHLS